MAGLEGQSPFRLHELMGQAVEVLSVPLCSGDGEEDSTSPAIAIIRDDESDPDKALHILHIIVGAFVVHLVGKKDVEHFDRLAHELMEAEWGLLFKAGHIQLLADWKSL